MQTEIAGCQPNTRAALACVSTGDGTRSADHVSIANVPGANSERAPRSSAPRSRSLRVEVGGIDHREHGVGIVEKINQILCTRPGICAHEIKHAFDEHGLLNPEQGGADLHHCAEFSRCEDCRGQADAVCGAERSFDNAGQRCPPANHGGRCPPHGVADADFERPNETTLSAAVDSPGATSMATV